MLSLHGWTRYTWKFKRICQITIIGRHYLKFVPSTGIAFTGGITPAHIHLLPVLHPPRNLASSWHSVGHRNRNKSQHRYRQLIQNLVPRLHSIVNIEEPMGTGTVKSSMQPRSQTGKFDSANRTAVQTVRRTLGALHATQPRSHKLLLNTAEGMLSVTVLYID